MRLIFEVATFADAVAKAARVAPTKAGEAFDKAAGLHISVVDGEVQLRSTDLKIFYLEVVDAVEIDGKREDGPFEWRLSSQILSGIVGKLRIGSGKQVRLEQVDNQVKLTAGRVSARLRMMNAEYYPTWDPFDPDLLDMVPDLGARIQQVEWAADSSGEPPLGGIHLDGEKIVSTDRFRLACVPCEAEPIQDPITVPAGIFAPVIKNMRDVRDVAIGVDQNQLLIMPDTSTQIRAAIYAVEYPNLNRALRRDHPDTIKFRKEEVLNMIELAGVFGMKERIPKLTVFIGEEEFAVMMSDQDEGLLGDVLDIPGQARHKRVKIFFTPKNLTDAIIASPSEEIELHYDKEKPGNQVRLDGGSGYEAWVMPRREKQKED
jgi:DNA polymerase III sliding clamp (beta) subunit (PCNA family)